MTDTCINRLINTPSPNISTYQKASYIKECSTITTPMAKPTIQTPVILTGTITSIDPNTASCSGNLVSRGKYGIVMKGICWNTAPSPAIVNNVTYNGTGYGVYVGTMTNLLEATTYYVRAYATDSRGVTTYGSEKSFVTESYNLTGYFVSAAGDDLNDGMSMDKPWKTIAKVNGKIFLPGDNIYFRRGDEWYGPLDPKASGNATNRITYGAYGTGNNPVISGFTTITGWTNEGNGIYSKVITSSASTNMVTLDGVSQAMGRTPNYGSWMTYTTLVNNNPGYTLVDSTLTNSPNWTGAEAVVYLNGWDLVRMKIDSHVNDTLTMTSLGWPGNTVDYLSNPKKYFIQNDLRTLTQIGEWYHDYAGSGKFYMYFGAVDPTTKVVKVATQSYLFKDYDGHDYLSVNNITFEGSIVTTIFNYAGNDNFILEDCTIKNSGVTGIKAYGANILINRNNFIDTNGCAALLFSTGQTVTNNTFTRQGMIEGLGAKENITRGAIRNYLGNNFIIANNYIIDSGFTGIALLGALTATITNNYIENSCYWRPDMGAIYTTGNTGLQVDMLIEGNIAIGSGGEGIYCDEYSTNVRVLNNSVSGTARSGIFLHKANNIIVTGNVTHDCYTGFQMSNWVNEPNLINLTVTQNSFTSVGATQVCLRYSTRNTSYASTFSAWNFDNNVYARPIDDNLTISVDLPSIGAVPKTLAQWKTLTNQDANSTSSPKSVSTVNDIYFYYNNTQSNSVISLPQPTMSMTGVSYPSNITLLPFKSSVLLKDGVNYYVSTSGSDSNNGLTEQTPWKTITKVNTTAFAPGDQIRFRGGDTFYGTLTPLQSGLSNSPITYTSYGTGKAVITGLTSITSWASLGGNIWESVSAASTLSYLNIVLINGVNTPMGRMPKIGNVYLTQSHTGNNSITSTDLAGTTNWTNAEVLLRKRGWAYEKGVVTSHVDSTITFTDAGVYSIDQDNIGFFLQADPKCLTQQNDWYYNPTTKKLRVYSVGTPTNVQVPTISTLTNLYNKDYIVFNNLRFKGANSYGVFLNTSDGSKVTNCTVEKVGLFGINSYDDHFSTVDNNILTDCNHVGINNGGGTSSGNTITNNVITNTYLIPGIGASVYPLGAICVTSNDTLVQFNDIDYSGYNGIIASSPAILIGTIKNNFINHSLQTLSDGGGIYSAGAHTDLVIEENIILNSAGYALGSPGGYLSAKGIYFDRGSVNITAKNNTVTGCEMGMTMSTDCVSNTFDNNVVFNNKWAIQITNLFTSIPNQTRSNIVTDNQFVTKLASSTIAKYQSIVENDMQNFFAEIDRNIYARPIDDTDTIWFYQPNMTTPRNLQPLSVWAAFIGQEANSVTSPYTITAESDVYMIYNKNKTVTNVSIPYTSKDLAGNVYTTSVSLQPFKSLILFKS